MSKTENLAILFADMVGFTERTSAQSREENSLLLYNFDRILLRQILAFGGRRIKSMGDAQLATFRSPTDCVRCAMAIQDALAEFNGGQPREQQIHVRIGINVGEVRLERRDVFGEAVNIAARVQALTPVNEVYLTGVVYLSMNKAEVPTEHLGEFDLKGIPEKVRLFQVRPRTLARLVPAEEPMDSQPGELPFGGMNHMLKTRGLYRRANVAVGVLGATDIKNWFRMAPWRRVGAAFGAAAVVAASVAGLEYLNRPGAPGAADSPAAQAGTVAAGGRQETQALLAREVVRHADSVYRLGRKTDATRQYARALELDPTLQEDPQVAAQVVGSLASVRDLAGDLVRKYPGQAMVDALHKRTSLAGRVGAREAARLLGELGHGDLVDQVGLALTELDEGATCEERLAAVRKLARLRSKRALPALKESVSGMKRFFSNSCLSSETQAAIEQLER